VPQRYDRFHAKDRPPDNRNAGQRDRDRILFTSAFRRLAGVTQVISAEEGQIFHNRLTHSIEVAQVGRRLAEKFSREQRELAAKNEVDPDVVEAACLAHDLGHPPFGHIAEKLLDELATAKKLADGFEGNAQSFRIVSKLAFRSPEIDGLNLTRATLNAILKYPWLRGASGKKSRKWGAYDSEQPEFTFARDLSSVGDETPCLEAQIMDWSDDVTYSVHDLEDFYRARLIPLHVLVAEQTERDRFYEGASKRLKKQESIDDAKMDELIRTFQVFVDSVPIDAPYGGTRVQRAALRSFTAGLIGRYVQNTKLNSAAAKLEIPEGHRREVKMLKQLTWHYVIENPALATQQFGQRRLLTDLFEIFHEVAATDYWHVFPTNSREELEDVFTTTPAGLDRDRAVTRIIVDLISSMTERHAISIHKRLTGIMLGSALEYIGW
jgi:dGTPase